MPRPVFTGEAIGMLAAAPKRHTLVATDVSGSTGLCRLAKERPMGRNLIIFGLGLIAAWILLKLASFVMEIALWAGVGLVVLGIVLHMLGRSKQQA